MSSALVKLLAKQPTARLHAMQAEGREQIEGLRYQDELITLALAEKAQVTAKGHPAQEAPKTKPEASPPERNGSAPLRRLDPGARGERREVFREILSEQSASPKTVAEILAGVEARQIETNAAAVRAMLRRMARDGEIVRFDHKRWKLASVNGSHAEESPTDASSVGPGGVGGESPWPPDDGSGASAAPNRSGVTS
jgi:hypothetical protein